MIDYEDFKGMCERVARITGRIDEETRRVYYEALKDHDRNVVFRAMRRVGKEHGFYKFPTIAEIMDAIRDSTEGHRPIPTWCPKCNLTGVILAEKDHRATAYRCDCPNAKRVSSNIRPFAEVAGQYGEGFPDEPRPLPVVMYHEIESLPESQVFEHGVTVEKICGVCWNAVRFSHYRKMDKKKLVEFHLKRASMCEPCYIEQGKKNGQWK